ncbi:hypothetical protein HYH03_011093 [Edaphochlamys debaryana]|uniref:Uncharacterized protein n=1 Tax=Edaphochlamys debaryana TaxID=47281 RepID=A0A835XXY7_9CHLO|nr:hypothetical protein HYH03_011093 [Edaphochlamys debaryana]|eukprot:KAG2490461.1 hypothetical protein HYH03_011093 [Edaphochlamys debaryana]
MADITSQLEACLEDYTDTGRGFPPASDEADAVVKAVDILKDFQVEMPGVYPQPSAQHVVIVTCDLTDGRGSASVPSGPDKGKHQPICA